MDSYDDDRPGMMRVHVWQERALELCDFYLRDELREIAKARGVRTGSWNNRKSQLALDLVQAGVRAPLSKS